MLIGACIMLIFESGLLAIGLGLLLMLGGLTADSSLVLTSSFYTIVAGAAAASVAAIAVTFSDLWRHK